MTLHAWRVYAVSPFANNALFVSGTPAVTPVTVTPSAATISKGGSIQLTATVTTQNFAPQGITWTSDSEMATVSPSGVVTISAEATSETPITITATSAFNPEVSGTATITVA